MKLTTFAFAALASMTVWGGVAQADQYMPAAEIRKMFPGKFKLVPAPGLEVYATVAANGTMSVVTNKGEKDTGHWRLDGDKICVQFTHLLDKKQECSFVEQDGRYFKGRGFVGSKL